MYPQPAKACPSPAEQTLPAATARRLRPPPRWQRQDGSSLANVLVGVAAAGLLASGGFYAFQHRSEIAPAAMQLVPEFVLRPGPAVVPLLDARALHVPAGTSHSVSFSVSDERPCVLTGRVLGVAGGRRDVEVYVLDRGGIADRSSTTGGQALFRSGRTSAVGLQVRLPGPGDYHLLVSNRFSVVSDKTVQVEDARVTCG